MEKKLVFLICLVLLNSAFVVFSNEYVISRGVNQNKDFTTYIMIGKKLDNYLDSAHQTKNINTNSNTIDLINENNSIPRDKKNITGLRLLTATMLMDI